MVGVASAATAASLPLRVAAGTTAPRVIVIGGGFGGATVAKYLKLWGDNVDVTLVEPNANHISCILSNLVVTGAIGMDRITLSYDGLKTRGVRVLQDRALHIDPVARRVSLASGVTLDYDRLVLSPGIDFLPVPGWDPNAIPHAWQAGPQTTLLKNQLAAMPSGGTFVMNIPKAPYRCPPGPYERACVVADYLVRKKPGSKIVVLDANGGILVEPHNFGLAFNETYRDVLEYHTNVTVTEADSATRTLYTSLGNFRGAVVNLLPNMQAGKIVRDTGLATEPTGRWAPVSALSYESASEAGIHVIGDSQATPQPKSGHMASSQAKVCADAILRSFAGIDPHPAPATNSACYSPISAKKASWLSANYQYDPGTRSMKLVSESFGEAKESSGDNYEEMFQWAANIFTDSFR